ncbi:MAG: serine hydrolase [Clostridiaceae bacterium]|nr:serine hydrolase [Clostridiaceae bacterium]MDD6274563.1 serine hydrolase [Clostridiaceae bacterium]
MQMKTELLKDFVGGVAEQKLGVRGIVVRQHGEILDQHDIVEPVERIQLFSASKTWTSMGAGIAMGEGLFQKTDRLIDLLADEIDFEVPAGYEKLTVEHLLTMSTGHDECPIFKAQRERMAKMPPEERPVPGNTRRGGSMSDLWFDAFMKTPLTYDPDERHFAYNNGTTYMLSLIVQKTSGQPLSEYLKPRVFAPLGLTDIEWDCDAKGRTLGAIGLHLTTEELSRGGQLLLNRGAWNGKQLIPAEYVDEMTTMRVPNDFGEGDPEARQGYGYQMWMCSYPKAYRMDGMFAQFSIGLPTLDAVVAITSHEPERGCDILRLVWDTIAPKLELTK